MTEFTGLSTAEADRYHEAHGYNEITQVSSHNPFTMFLDQLRSPLVIILIIATIVSLLLGDIFEGVLIILIVILNAVLGFVQEYKAEKALESLKKITISVVRVLRDGQHREIDSKLLVPGDIIVLEEGNKVPADCELLESLHMEVDESALTGESMPVEKTVSNPRENSLFMGTTVTRGRSTARVKTIGMETRFGHIAMKLSTIVKEETQLEKKLAGVAKQLGIVAIVAGLIISSVGIMQGQTILVILLTAISLAVAAVPEGLPAIVTVTLAVGTQRMAKKKAILRKLSAIEALGGITVIATDKTGTLTKNEMRVTRIWAADEIIHVSDAPIKQTSNILGNLIKTGAICNNASLASIKDHNREFDVVGDKTEGALLILAHNAHMNTKSLRDIGELVDEFAFDATTKTMSVVWKQGNIVKVHTKGAPESILARSTRIATLQGERELSQKEKIKIENEFQQFAKDGLRLIALATKTIQWKNQTREEAENNLTFLGFVGISDPPRAEVSEAIRIAQKAGIRTIMITGDNELTAYAIGRKIGLLNAGDEVITGVQFATLSHQSRLARLPRVSVFARTTPEQKLEIVKLLQSLGEIVAVTGDGVNDALALKQANVGIAMGITGTDVAKEAADMIITDDNYATIVSAVEEGRIIYENMKSSIKYLLGSNIGEILSLLGGVLMGWPFILLPIQILYINLITDGLPALSLALNSKHHNIMSHSPRRENELFSKYDYRWFSEVSFLTGLATLSAFWIGWRQGNLELARTLAFVVIALAQQYIFLDIANGSRSIISWSFFKNRWILIPVSFMVFQVILAHTQWFRNIFHIVPPHWIPISLAFGICSVMVITAEFRKRLAKRYFYDE